MAAVEAPRKPRTYGNWRRPTSAGLLGLGSIGTGLMLGGLIFVTIVLMLGGPLRGLLAAAVLGAALLVILIKDPDGRNLLDRALARTAWWRARTAGSHLYRSGPLGRVPWGTCQLPGLGAALTLSEHHDSYDRPFALVHSPAAGTYTVVLATTPDGASLVDADQVDLWVADWGHWLQNLGNEPNVEAASVTIETAPDSGSRLRREVGVNIDPNAPTFAREMLEEIVERYPAGSSLIRGYVAITFSSRSGGSGKRTASDMGRDLAARLPGLTQDLQATGAGASRPLSSAELCEIVRIAYDPATQALIDDAHAAGESTDLSWSDVGPSAHQANWADYRHDSGLSATWSMSVAPRGNVQSGVLTRLLTPHRDIARKRVTILYRPIDPARAAAIVESDLRNANFRATSTRRPAVRDVMATRLATATAAEEASGAGLVDFAIVVTATALRVEDGPQVRAAIDNLAPTARLKLRPTYGSQDVGFIAGLPLGIIPSKHVKLPTELKDRL